MQEARELLPRYHYFAGDYSTCSGSSTVYGDTPTKIKKIITESIQAHEEIVHNFESCPEISRGIVYPFSTLSPPANFYGKLPQPK